jgi:hypothetical protein
VCWRSAVPGKHLQRAAYLMVDILILLLSRSAEPHSLYTALCNFNLQGLPLNAMRCRLENRDQPGYAGHVPHSMITKIKHHSTKQGLRIY